MTIHRLQAAVPGPEPQDAIVLARAQRDGRAGQSGFFTENLRISCLGIAPSVQGTTMCGLDFRRVQTGPLP